MMQDLKGRSALITGGGRGLGLEIAKTFVAAGANVFLCGRDKATLEQARIELAGIATLEQRVVVQSADVSKPESVNDIVSAALREFPGLQVLVSNAGVYGPIGPIEAVEWDEWVRALEINLFGSILMCRALVPHFKRLGYGKIIQLSGGGATNPLPNLSAYAASKAAVIRFSETLAEELRESRVDVNAIAPGALNTQMLDEVINAGADKVGADFYRRAQAQLASGGTPLSKGAALAVYLASAASDGLTGKLLSAVWDPWPELDAHRGDLDRSDIYTLRRIVPKDRQKTWGDR